jgi:uncharacterized membrane protein YdjX (TVP38/TMEM64 family)
VVSLVWTTTALEGNMVGALSVISVVVGAACAYMAGRYPRHRKNMETFGGALLISGFALLGYSLERLLAPC